MASKRDDGEITPELVLQAYRCGIFPMAESASDPALHWYEPRKRGIMPLDAFHIPRSLAKVVRSDRFEVSVDQDFDGVIEGCAQSAPGRENTWINSTICALYRQLFTMGHCHTVEVRRSGMLVGGLYGVSIGGAFFGESMFHRETDASKVALVHLVGRLRNGGYKLLDAQFVTSHLLRFGAIEIDKSLYQLLLAQAVPAKPCPKTWTTCLSGAVILEMARN